MYALGDLSYRIAKDRHIIVHADTVMRLCTEIYNSKITEFDLKFMASKKTIEAMIASANLLLDWMSGQRNADIAKHAQEAIRELKK